MEIERKFLVSLLPSQLEHYPKRIISQAYLCTNPVLRIRQNNSSYILTYKSSGLRSRIEEEMPLTQEAFAHLLKKTDGNIISKTRYEIPHTFQNHAYTIELDVFHGIYEGLFLAEVEFENEEDADAYEPPEWFGTEVTYDGRYHNSSLCTLTPQEIKKLVAG